MADASDAVAEVTPDGSEPTPVVEVPSGEPAAESTPAEPAAEATPAADYSWIEQAGGEDAVREAWEFRQAVKTEEGAIDAFVEFGVALGLTPQQLASLFPEEAAALEEAEEELDRPMTKREAEAYVQQLIADQVLSPMQARDEAQATAAVRDTLVTTLDTAQIPEEDRRMVLQFADKYVPDEQRYDTAVVKAGVEKGIQDYNAWLERQVEARIKGKVEANQGLPTPVTSGTSPGGEEAAEPMSLAEAKARVRAARG